MISNTVILDSSCESATRERLELQRADGRVVCSLTIDRMLAYGDSGETIIVNGIGNVFTDEEFRKQGYAAQLMREAVSRQKQGDADISLLYGIDHFYHRFGYESCGEEQWLTVKVSDTLPAAPTAILRNYKPDDLAAIENIFESVSCATPGSVRRIGALIWNSLNDSPDENKLRVVEINKVLVGYVWAGAEHGFCDDAEREHPSTFIPSEVMCVDSHEAAATTLHCALNWAREMNLEFVRIAAPATHPVTQLGVGHFVREDRPNGGMMALSLRDNIAAPEDWYQFLPDRF